MSEAYHCDEDDALEILKRIPNNPSTMPFRHWVTGDFPTDDLGLDDCIEALLWSDHGVAIRAVDDVPNRTYWVNHNGDLQALTDDCAIRSPHEAAVMLEGELRTETIDVVAILTEDAPEPARSVGKEIVTDGGQDMIRAAARVYCTNCKQWNSHNDGDCNICGEAIKEVATDGGRPPLRRCTDCGLIHRPTEACRAANGGGDR